MNRFIIVTIIIVVLLAGGVVLYNTNRNAPQSGQGDHSMEEMGGKPVAQSHRSYELEVTSNTEEIKPQQPVALSYKIKNDKGEVLKNYDVVHEKIMHFIVVRKDLQEFLHLHPEFNESTGEFTIAITFPTDGVYRIFPDFTPGDANPQKLPVTVNKDINVGDLSKYSPQPLVVDTNASKTAEGYTINYKLNPAQPKTQSDLAILRIP